MARDWRLGAHAYAAVGSLPAHPRLPGCTFALVRRDGEGPRCLLQVWEPRPAEKVLDTLRAEFLQGFSLSESMDPGISHFGFDSDKVWLLQELGGTPLTRLWGQAPEEGRRALRERIHGEAAGSRLARCLDPEVIGVRPGRVLAPWILGLPADPSAALLPVPEASLPPLEASGCPWMEAPGLADLVRTPVRGRSQELTYLKSLVFGLSSAIPMERILLILGEVGLGHERLCEWTAAIAETEGRWVHFLDLQPQERAGVFLGRLVQELIDGSEAALYAAQPSVARVLSRRLPTFAFLRPGRRTDYEEREVDGAEADAALEALAFAHARHPRLILIRGLEGASAEVHDLLKELVLDSRLPWVLSSRGGVGRSCTTALRRHAEAATVMLDRLEDVHLREVLTDVLGPHDLSESQQAELCAATLGNPGLLHGFLEVCQNTGALVHQGGRWAFPEGIPPMVAQQHELVQRILEGRLSRLNAAALALVRYLALADMPLSPVTLGGAMGLDGDGVEDAVSIAVNAKLVLACDSGARLPSAQVRDLALAGMPAHEVVRCARLLLKLLEGAGRRPLLSVRLQSFALDAPTALAQVLQAIEGERPGPASAQRVLDEALKLAPSAPQKARLWEFLSDNWCAATEGGRWSTAASGGRSPYECALESLDAALGVLGDPGTEDGEELRARLQRKKGLLELRLRRFSTAEESLEEAARLLADHPFHPEQPRLRLAQGRWQEATGGGARGLAVLEEGLRLLGQQVAGDHRDQADLLLELGQAQGQRALFQSALRTLHSTQRLLEHSGDHRRMVETQRVLANVHLNLGQPEPAALCLRDAMELARGLDDIELVASCHLSLGILRSCQDQLGPAQVHLDSAYRRFASLGDQVMATQAQVWKARTLAAMGDITLAELLLMQASAIPADALTPQERGDRGLVEGEIAAFKAAWSEAARHFQSASNRFSEAGLVWRQRIARLCSLQAQALADSGPAALKAGWIRLEGLKGPVEATGSRWLELHWHRAHALLLSMSGEDEGVMSGALLAWEEVLACAREQKFPSEVLGASVRVAELLLLRGEPLGARSRVQDAMGAFQEIWSKLPENYEKTFLERHDIQRLRRAAEATGLPFTLPDRVDALADWSPTQVNLPWIPSSRNLP